MANLRKASGVRIVMRTVGDGKENVMQADVDGNWIEIDAERIPEWAVVQAATLGSTEWKSRFAYWIDLQNEERKRRIHEANK